MSIFKWPCSSKMDYFKYLNCQECQEIGLYCKPHRIEVESDLHKMEMKNILQMQDHQSTEYVNALKELIKSYEVWKAAKS